MKGRKPIDSGSVCHIYQRTINGFQLFYCVKDYLLFYTIVAIAARRYGIKVLGFCQMPDHIHLLVQAAIKRFGPDAVSILLGMKEAVRWKTAVILQRMTGATRHQVCKFLHLAMQTSESQ